MLLLACLDLITIACTVYGFVFVEPACSDKKSDEASETASTENAPQGDDANADAAPVPVKKVASGGDANEWTITFEQFVASMLTEQALTEFFGAEHKIDSEIGVLRSNHAVERVHLTPSTP